MLRQVKNTVNSYRVKPKSDFRFFKNHFPADMKGGKH